MCGRTFTLRLLSACCFLAWASATASAAPPSEAPPPNGTAGAQQPNSQPPTWTSFDELLTMLESEAADLSTESTLLLSALLASQIEANALRTSLDLSERSLADFERSTTAERKAAMEALDRAIELGARAEISRDRWRIAGIIGIGAAALEAVIIGLIVALR